MSFIQFKSFVSNNSFQSIHAFQFLDFTHSCQFIRFKSFMSIHSCQVVDLNSFISIHSLTVTFIQFHSFLSIRSCQLIHVKAFISCISFHFNSLLSNSPWIPIINVSFSKLPPRRVPGTTWQWWWTVDSIPLKMIHSSIHCSTGWEIY